MWCAELGVYRFHHICHCKVKLCQVADRFRPFLPGEARDVVLLTLEGLLGELRLGTAVGTLEFAELAKRS